MKGCPSAFYFFEDVRGRRSPDKRLWMGVMKGDVRVDGFGEFFDTAKDAAANALHGKVAKEAFDPVQPGGAGRREVKVEARIALLPRLDLFMLVRRVVLADEVNLFVRGSGLLDEPQKAQPLLMQAPMTLPSSVFSAAKSEVVPLRL